LGDINYPTYKRLDKVVEKKNRTLREMTKKNIVIDGVEYGSIRDAARQTGIDRSTIKGRVYSDKFPNYVSLATT
jgi:hypothetical protein